MNGLWRVFISKCGVLNGAKRCVLVALRLGARCLGVSRLLCCRRTPKADL
jgi:hypothetical protein